MLMMGSFWSLAALTQQERRRKRIRRRRGRRGRVMWEFPVDLVTEILIRLPEKSLMRFKCVSKQWSSLISCRYFCDRVFTLTRQRQPRLYMSLVDDDDGQRELLSISSTSPDNTSFVVDQDLSIPGMGGLFLNGARGLMCFSRRKKACIYNPSTKQILTLPRVKPDIRAEQGQRKHHNRYYIGHDPVNDQYKILCTIVIASDLLRSLKSEHWVFVLEAGGSWKKVVPHENYRHPHAPFTLGRSISSGSVVRYMAWRDNYHCEVVCFDVRSEELTTILVPRDVGLHVRIPVFHLKADLIEYGGEIAIFDHSYLQDGGETELWVLEKEWSRKKSLVLQPCQRHLVNDVELIVKGITQDGKVILAPPLEMSYGFYILCYDLQSNDLRKVEIQGIPQVWYDKECYFDLRYMDESESVIYLET
uniref:F-box/LRR-repeat protein n=1 Tax=Noccaea caerulescens TaxID=107243 RepID=A0A1J3JKD7_NOCCA